MTDAVQKHELADWEKRLLADRAMLKNYRGRRSRACRAADTLHEVIENLGIEDGSQLPQPDKDFLPAPSDMMKQEMQNAVANLLRMILLLNDGNISRQTLRRF